MTLKYMKKACLVMLLYASNSSLLQAQTDTAGADNYVDSVYTIGTGYRNIGFGKQPAKYVTSSISTIYSSGLEKNFTLNLGNTLYGRAAGLNVRQGSSDPGAGVPGILVRGVNTFGDAGNLPLYVIDGFISNGSATSNGFMQLIPEEIESITVLKDAAATAVYGSRAANGVILVTTKRGGDGPLKVSFTTKQGFNQAQQLPKFLNSYDYARYYNEALVNEGQLPRYSDSVLNLYKTGSDPYFYPNVNWYDEVLRPTSYASNYNLSLSGGDQTVKFSVVLNGLLSDGLFKKFGDQSEESYNSNYSRYNFRTNLDINVSKRLLVEFRVGGSFEEIKNPFDYTASSTFSRLATLPPNAFPVYNPNGSFGGNSLYDNPFANLLATGFYKSNARTILSSLKFTQQLDMITKGLSAAADISINNYFKSGSYKSKQYARYALAKGAAGDTIYQLVNGTQKTSLVGGEQTLDQYRNLIMQVFLNYHRTFGKHDVSGMLMFNRDEITLFGPAGDPTNPTANSTDPYRHNNASGRYTYVYNDKYIAEFNGSYMASNIFPKGKRGGFFPAGSIGWIASNESFLKNSKSIDFLKLRGSYGKVGNDVIVPLGLSSRYSLFNQTYSGTAGYLFGNPLVNAGGIAEGILANPNLTWESEKSYNVGFDATLFKNFDLSVEYFNRDRTGIIVSSARLIPQYLGAVAPSLNQGKSNSKGIEATLRYNSNPTKTFRFFVEGNISYAKQTIIFNAEALQLNKGLLTTGTTVGQPFGYKAIGFFSQAEIAARLIDPKSYPATTTGIIRPGDVKYQDIGGPGGVPDGIIDGNDVQPIGKTNIAPIIAGLHAGFQCKGFDLDMMFQGVTGNNVYLGGNYFQAFQSNGQIAPIALDRWTPATAATATYPRLSTTNNLNNYLTSSLWQRDGSFIKLRSAEAGYTFSNKMIQSAKLSSVRIFVNGTNLFSIDHIPYGDPESLTGYPVIRTVTGGVRINL